MAHRNTRRLDSHGKMNKQPGSGLDPLVVFNLLKKNWYWFVLTTLIALYGARFYLVIHCLLIKLQSLSLSMKLKTVQ